MIKTLKFLILLFLVGVLSLQFVACNNIKVAYYLGTDVPTFTCVTGIEKTSTGYMEDGTPYYKYVTSKSEKCADKYIDYLINEQGFTELESGMEKYSITMLIKGAYGVLIDQSEDNTVKVMPYDRY